jgi:hypothetical protein
VEVHRCAQAFEASTRTRDEDELFVHAAIIVAFKVAEHDTIQQEDRATNGHVHAIPSATIRYHTSSTVAISATAVAAAASGQPAHVTHCIISLAVRTRVANKDEQKYVCEKEDDDP